MKQSDVEGSTVLYFFYFLPARVRSLLSRD